MIEGLKALHVYVDGREFDIYMDHESLKYLMTSRYTRKKLAAWALELQNYAVRNIYHVAGITNTVPKALSRLPLTKFLEEKPPEAPGEVNVLQFLETDIDEESYFCVNDLDTGTTIESLSARNLKEIKTAQRDDPKLNKIILYMEGNLDLADPQYKSIMSLSDKFILWHNRLYFVSKVKNKRLAKRFMKFKILENHTVCCKVLSNNK